MKIKNKTQQKLLFIALMVLITVIVYQIRNPIVIFKHQLLKAGNFDSRNFFEDREQSNPERRDSRGYSPPRRDDSSRGRQGNLNGPFKGQHQSQRHQDPSRDQWHNRNQGTKRRDGPSHPQRQSHSVRHSCYSPGARLDPPEAKNTQQTPTKA